MFINIGGNVVIKSNELVAVLDIHNMNHPKSSQSLVGKYLGNPHPIEVNSCKSIVVTADKAYYSPHSSATLLKRFK